MAGVLLDTHALYWLVSGATALAEDALAAIGESQSAGTLFVSPITAWELSLAAQKPRIVTHHDWMRRYRHGFGMLFEQRRQRSFRSSEELRSRLPEYRS